VVVGLSASILSALALSASGHSELSLADSQLGGAAAAPTSTRPRIVATPRVGSTRPTLQLQRPRATRAPTRPNTQTARPREAPRIIANPRITAIPRPGTPAQQIPRVIATPRVGPPIFNPKNNGWGNVTPSGVVCAAGAKCLMQCRPDGACGIISNQKCAPGDKCTPVGPTPVLDGNCPAGHAELCTKQCFPSGSCTYLPYGSACAPGAKCTTLFGATRKQRP